MRITTAAAVALAVGLPTLAYADGMPASRAAVTPPFTWNGFYAGVNLGYGWNDDDKTIILRDGSGVFGACTAGSSCATSIFPEGWFGGGQLGYNWQTGPWVLGIETDIQGADINSDVHHRALFLPALGAGADFLNARRDIDYFGTIRGRAGYAIDRALVYATGGFAYGGVTDRFVVFTPTGTTAVLSRDDTQTGFSVGAGIEFAFATQWSAKFEYQYIDLGDERLTDRTHLTALNTSRFDDHFNTFRVGLNYRFGTDRYYAAPMK